MTAIRLGAVGYLNARPLVCGLDKRQDLFALRFDVPSKCASLLHDGAIDLGLIPSIEYLRGDYSLVPGISVSSTGAVASVALFSTRPVQSVRSIAVDSSSRTSATLLRILCSQWFEIDAKFVTMPPDASAMTKRCDAALIIGDEALFLDHDALGLDKVDLGEEWTAMTGLPFVWACWAGRKSVATPEHVAALQAARDAGVADPAAIAQEYCKDDADRAERGAEYLTRHIKYGLGDQECAGLKKFFDAAQDLRLVANERPLRFY